MLSFFLFLMIYSTQVSGYGYDSGTDQTACGKPYRSAKMYQPPCDLARQTYCTSAGASYPWHAVRRFIRENQGLMKRMYGSERHIAVLKAELENNDIEEYNSILTQNFDYNGREFKNRYSKQDNSFENEVQKDSARYLQDNKLDEILNTKFVYSDEESISLKLGEMKIVPHVKSTIENTEKTTVTEETSEVVNTTVYQNLTKSLIGNTKKNSTVIDKYLEDTFTTTEDSTEETTTVLTPEDVTTEEVKKNVEETVLFQDMDNNANKITKPVNYKRRGVNACPVKEEVVAPFWANNTRGEVLALLNLYPFEQYVHWEKCTYEHRQMYCREGCRCEQQYRLHRLLAYDPNNECRGIFSDWFKLPSCCVCKCYDIPTEFRVTSRSPRNNEEGHIVPNWFKSYDRSKESD